VEGRPKPWWEDNPELEEIRRRTLEELQCGPDDREPIDPEAPDPVLDEILSGGSWRELADARDDLSRSRARYEEAVRTARTAGLSWAEIGRVLGVSKQLLHRRFRRTTAPPAP
jgi:DNA-directed RNA polymerase specialized sigma24 family protein